MGILRSLKRGIIIGGLVGALAGSQYGSVRDAYQDVLKADIDQKEAIIDYIKDHKDNYADKKAYLFALEGVKNEYNSSKEKLKEYNNLPDEQKTKKALKDVGNYGLTIKNLEFGLPSSKKNWEGAGKGAIGGAVGGGVLLAGLSARRAIRKKSNKNLEKRVSIFLGLLVGGVGLYLTSSNVLGKITGNVVGNVINVEGIVGILMLLVGIFCSYEYFKEN